MGLAFDEDRVIEKLSLMAKEGWVLKEMSLFRYKLGEDKPKELIYSMDYKKLDKDDKEYFEFFESSGWKHMCSYGQFHFFSAAPGTVPIYTDKENYLSKYSDAKKSYFKSLVISLLALLSTVLVQITQGDKLHGTTAETIILIIGVISSAIVVPSLMVCIAYLVKERKVLKNNFK
jgi:hypothetical protein